VFFFIRDFGSVSFCKLQEYQSNLLIVKLSHLRIQGSCVVQINFNPFIYFCRTSTMKTLLILAILFILILMLARLNKFRFFWVFGSLFLASFQFIWNEINISYLRSIYHIVGARLFFSDFGKQGLLLLTPCSALFFCRKLNRYCEIQDGKKDRAATRVCLTGPVVLLPDCLWRWNTAAGKLNLAEGGIFRLRIIWIIYHFLPEILRRKGLNQTITHEYCFQKSNHSYPEYHETHKKGYFVIFLMSNAH